MKKIPLLHLLLVAVLWAFFTFIYAKIFGNPGQMPLADLISKSFSVNLLLAALTVTVYSYIRPANIIVGLNKIKTKKNWILIYPIFIIVLSLFSSGLNGVYANFDSYKWALINCLFVGISEELMFRGVLLSSLTKKIGFIKAALIVIFLFGAIHVLNVFTTGELGQGIAQACMAMSSGILFLAVRVKTLSIIPAIILHALWDFAAFTMATIPEGESVEGGAATLGVLVSLLFAASPIILGILGVIQLTRKNAVAEFVKTQEAAI
ncbi:CPBP family intramembrane metalloprotease [Tamlana haliotis]|uniref:CPBP family intramembrane metalloprotease n=1 Tax=Pseudotamlana haliotis TaxID=2614804 RepID=A0A6N6MLL4_9FLAO|nr:CPBP family intramembrane glutamic endopeptidase [Tamlana haliotis]KAB1069157.1 CPBP family intramembrane metalloprotease [Tamlana haliotis]